ncbi:MAG: hypothetical protein B6241_12355 [Spirochaetaceae bacterium 4572_59]|nr:MAG: hypothetical protein B6241_12355 [Spirochaetaceae bacterium 4572_59]
MDFYKYYSLNSDFTWEALREDYFYFSSPSQLNDPFDCRVNLIWKGDESDTKKWLQKKDFKNKDIDMLAKHIHNYDIQLDDFTPEEYKAARDGIKIFSVTTNPENILMWSHYANNHTGICVKIKTIKWYGDIGVKFRACNFTRELVHDYPQGYIPFSEVKYKYEMPSAVNMLYIKDNDHALERFILTKHFDWSYEEEYRTTAFIHDIYDQKMKYHTDTIQEVIFGMDCSNDHKEYIIDIFKNKEKSKVVFKQAEPIKTEYGLNIVDYY